MQTMILLAKRILMLLVLTATCAGAADVGHRIVLHARDAKIHGTTVRYEPQPHKDTIGYWTKLEDWVSWDFHATNAGTYEVEILQGCGKGSGGSEVEFLVAGQ